MSRVNPLVALASFMLISPVIVCGFPRKVEADPTISCTSCDGDHAGNHENHCQGSQGIDVGATMWLITSPEGGTTAYSSDQHHCGIYDTNESPLEWSGTMSNLGTYVVDHIEGWRHDGCSFRYPADVSEDYSGTSWWCSWGSGGGGGS